MHCRLTLGLLSSLLAVSAHALADEPTANTPPTSPADDTTPNVQVTGGLGYLQGLDGPSAVVADVLALKRIGPLAVGGNVQGGTRVLSNHYVSLGPSIGLFIPTPRWLEVGIVGTVGARGYTGFSRHRNFFSDDPGASAVVGFASVRAVVAWSLRTAKTSRLSIGVQGVVDDDIARTTQRYTYSDDGPLLDFWGTGSRTQSVQAAEKVGVLRVGGMLALGASF